MATSGSSNYTETRDDIISNALQLLGVLGSGETPTASDVTFCSNALNRMTKAWQAQGIHLWKETTATITIVADQYQYSVSPRPLNIENCRYHYASGLERKMKKLGRSEYDAIPTKTTSEGASTCFYYSPQLTTGQLYVWPVPQDTTDTLVITYMASIEDFDSASDNPDFPVEWLSCITTNLAVKVAPAFGLVLSKVNPDLMMQAQQELADMQAWDFEEGSVRITPNYRFD
jgi:hypothetical protein